MKKTPNEENIFLVKHFCLEPLSSSACPLLKANEAQRDLNFPFIWAYPTVMSPEGQLKFRVRGDYLVIARRREK